MPDQTSNARGKLMSGAPFPALSWPTVGGGRLDLAAIPGWRLLIVYRGKHCPICKGYLTTLNELLPEFEQAWISVAALSADPLEKAKADVAKYNWAFPVGYDLKPDEMRELGLYISDPLSPDETDRPFPEPGLFAVNPDGRLQVIDISSAPIARPDLRAVLQGLKFMIAKHYPIRGQA